MSREPGWKSSWKSSGHVTLIMTSAQVARHLQLLPTADLPRVFVVEESILSQNLKNIEADSGILTSRFSYISRWFYLKTLIRMVAVHEQKCYVLILSKTSEAGWTEHFLSEKKLDFVMITRTLNYKITLPSSPPPPKKKKKTHKNKNKNKNSIFHPLTWIRDNRLTT